MQDVRLGAQTAWSKWVLALDAIDLLAPSDWAASREPAHVGLRALQRLVLQRVGPLKRLVGRCQFEGLLDLERARHGDAAATCLGNLKLDTGRDHLVFSMVAGQVTQTYTLERRITQLERVAPGLGAAVLDWIGRAGWRTIPVLSPEFVLQMVAIEQWMGAADESDVIKMWRSEGMREDEIQQAELIRRADLDAQFPAYALCPPAKFSRRVLKQLTTHTQPWIGEVARTLLQIIDLVARKDARLLKEDGIDLDRIYVGAVLRWNDRDMAVDVYDNFVNYYMQGDGYTELQSVEAVPTDPIAIREFFKRLDDGLQLLAALDRLIVLVTEPRRPERTNRNDESDR